VLAIPGAHFHDYARRTPGRKVGHVTIAAADADELQARVARLAGLPGWVPA
jgi:phosphoribosylaminoimidazole carboxylase (NCAIR synthetase)